LVLPTHSDTWGLVVNEAMACGLPIIVTSVAGCAADLVEDRWNGRVVAAHSVRQLASTMSQLAADPALRARMAEHSRERIALYSPELCASGMAQSVRAIWDVHES
jgi:glycosyltransferase involved in cell wall biosynthesis